VITANATEQFAAGAVRRAATLAPAFAAVLVACAPMVWDKPGITQTQFNQDNARCRLVARGMNSGEFYAQGSAGYVAGAAIGNAIGTGVATREDYKDCMIAAGYTQATPALAAATEAMKSTTAKLQGCMSAVFSSPAAAPLAAREPFLANAPSQAQLANSSFATDDEIAAFNAVTPQQEQCQKTAITAFSTSAPAAVRIFSATMTATASDRDMLKARRITWGQYNTRRRDHAIAAQAQLAAALGGGQSP
jgi:hypothetical protein